MNHNSRVLLLVAILFSTCLASAQDTETIQGHPVKAHQVLFRLSSLSSSVLQRLSQLADADDFRALSRGLNIYVLHSKSATGAALLNILKNDPAIAYIEPDYIVKAVGTVPNDTYFPQQWALLNTSNVGADIGATGAWTVSTGGTASIAAVVDTGIDYTHPDLAANVWSAPAPFSVTMSWGTLTCPAGSHGYNSIARSCDPKDDHGHGTHVSGTIGAIANNAQGVAGVNWTARIMALKFLDSSGSGTDSDAIDAIEFGLQAKSIFGAAANIRVFSNSWGGDGYSQALLDEINRANTADALFVAAAGNSTQNDDTMPTYPASYTAPNMVTVAATTSTDGLASFSNYGPRTVHLGAPGVNILSTLPNASYGYLSGTSMATPHVSGSALLLLSVCTLNAASLKNTLLANVDPIASLSGITVTGGRLNVNKAIHYCVNPPAPTGTASFLKTDTTTAGSWKAVYGSDGYNIIDDTANYPAYVTVTPSGNASYIWAASNADTRAMQKASSASDRIAACWYSTTSFSTDLHFSDSSAHQVAFYLLDWDNYYGRAERVDILDANNTLLDSRSVSGFVGGEYLVWNLSGHVVVRVTNLKAGSNAVVSGLLFGTGGVIPPAPADLTIVKTHSGPFTQGQSGATYTITVTNSGGTPTSGTVSVTDALPSALTATALAGTGWSCSTSTLTCTRSDALGPGASYPAITLTANVANNAPSSVTNTATVSGGGETNTNNDTASDPTAIQPFGATAFLTGFALNGPPLRNNFGNFVGMKLTVGLNALSVNAVGRICIAGNSGTHTVKFVNASTGVDVPGASVQVSMSGCTAGQFRYASLGSPVTLQANAAYYLVSGETLSGDQWYDFGAVSSTNVAAVNNSIWFDGTNWNPVSGPNSSYVPPNFQYTAAASGPPDLTIAGTHADPFTQGQTGATYNITVTNSGGSPTSGTVTVTDTLPSGLTATALAGTGWTCSLGTLTCTRTDALGAGVPYPAITLTVNVAANAAASVSNSVTVSGGGEGNTNNDTANDLTTIQRVGTTSFLTGFALNSPPLRNDFGNFVGMRFTVGPNALTVSTVGRICIAGNSGTHTVKFVNAGTGIDVPGGLVQVSMSGCTAGQFKYASLGSPITLAANTAYYLVSMEATGGDQWYDYGTVSSTNVAAVNNSVWFNGTNWNAVSGSNSSYVPVNFQY